MCFNFLKGSTWIKTNSFVSYLLTTQSWSLPNHVTENGSESGRRTELSYIMIVQNSSSSDKSDDLNRLTWLQVNLSFDLKTWRYKSDITFTPCCTFPPCRLLCYSEECTFYSVRFLDSFKTLRWTQELLKRRYADLTLSKLSTLKSVKELINHLSLLVKEPKVELHGSVGLTSKTRSWFVNFTNTTLETCTSTTSVTVHKWSIHTFKDNLHSRLSFSGADFKRLT